MLDHSVVMTKPLPRNASELAINGAKPAFVEPIHVGRPNVVNRERFMQLTADILDRLWLSNNGPLVQEFERKLAAFLGVKHCIAVCNATVGLEIAIRALKFEGEVIVPSYTFVATAHALHWQGITPVFADIDPVTQCLDPDAVRQMITPKTTGIIGVHLWGRAAEIADLETLAREHDLKLIFDAAHAFGCSHGGTMIGSFGACEVFSFHATKFLNSFEGGVIATNDDELAHTCGLMRNFGFAGYDRVIHPGTNGKMVEVCAAMGLSNLEQIDTVIEANARNYHAYQRGLEDVPGVDLLTYSENERNNFQYMVLEVDHKKLGRSRDEVVKALQAENVLARRYFWPGCHRMKPYCDLFPWVDRLLPHTNAVAEKVVVLPTGTAIGPEEIEMICRIIALQHG
jgi:dTDP-4-amino-4,6-dideoxygalactose transaminase